MVRPRWQKKKSTTEVKLWESWKKIFGVITLLNLAWIIFDISYIPIRNFWTSRNINHLSTPLILSTQKSLPSFISYYDSIKGIEPDKKSQRFLSHFTDLNKTFKTNGLRSPEAQKSRKESLLLITQIINFTPDNDSKNINNLEKIRSRLRNRASIDSTVDSAAYLLGEKHISESVWEIEYKFWEKEIIPLIASNYSRNKDHNGNYINRSWLIDLPFQILFIIDIFIRVLLIKKRIPSLSWKESLLRRFIDIPLLLPFWRPLRIIPAIGRISELEIIQVDPTRAFIGKAIISLVTHEMVEALAIRIIEASQEIIDSPEIPQKLKNLSLFKSGIRNKRNKYIQFINLWIPIFLIRIAPKMRPKIITLFSEALQTSLKNPTIPISIKKLDLVEKAESALSYQLAAGMTDTLIDLSRKTGDNFIQKDLLIEELGVDILNSFLEELITILENRPILERSQEILVGILKDLKQSIVKASRKEEYLIKKS